MRHEIMSLSEQHPRYGYRRVTAMLRLGGSKINAKRVQRVTREQGLPSEQKAEENEAAWTFDRRAAAGDQGQ
jgi:hypothetical protein